MQYILLYHVSRYVPSSGFMNSATLKNTEVLGVLEYYQCTSALNEIFELQRAAP